MQEHAKKALRTEIIAGIKMMLNDCIPWLQDYEQVLLWRRLLFFPIGNSILLEDQQEEPKGNSLRSALRKHKPLIQ